MSLAVKQPTRQRKTQARWSSSLSSDLSSLILFSRQLAVLYRSGIPLTSALRTLAQQSSDYSLNFILLGVLQSLKRGATLAQAFSLYPQAFSSTYVALIKEGEKTGTLEQALDKAAEFLEKEYALRKRVGAALTYPLFTLAVGTLTGVVCMKLMGPILKEVLSGHDSLPFLTQILLALAQLLTNPWTFFTVLTLALVLFIVVRRKLRTPHGKELKDRTLLRLPLVGTVVQQCCLCRVARTMAVSLKAGMPLTLVLELCSQVASNEVYREDLLQARQALIDGSSLEKYFAQKRSLYTPAFCGMVVTGQETGNLDLLAEKLADILELGAGLGTDNLLAMLQPLVFVVMGVGVGLLGVGILLPIYQLL